MTALAARARSTGSSEGKPKRMHFHGSLAELQDLVLLTGIYGEWHEQPNGVWRFRCLGCGWKGDITPPFPVTRLSTAACPTKETR